MKKKTLCCYLIIFLFTFTYFYFYMGNVYYVGDDTIFHTSNILVMADEISLFNPISGKIFPTLVSNLGYGVNLFYPGFPHIVGSYVYKFLSLFVAFGAAVIGGYGIRLFNGKIQKVLIVISIILFGFSNYHLTSKLDYKDIDKIDFLKDECCSLQWSYEYLPNISKYHSLYLFNKRLDLDIPDNNFRIISNDVPEMEFEILDIKEEVTIEFPRIYYLGYELKNDDGKEIDLYQNFFGLLAADIEENGTYELKYKGTIMDRVTRVLSIVTIIGLFGCFLFNKMLKKEKL